MRSLEIGDEKDVEGLSDLQLKTQKLMYVLTNAAEVDVCSHSSHMKSVRSASRNSANSAEEFASSSSDDEGVEACPEPVALSWCWMLLLSTALILAFLLVWMVIYIIFSQSGEEHQHLHFLKKALPSSNKECLWDYRRARCTFPEVCSYQYQFGDMTLSRSCRLKSSNSFSVVKALPTSDKECLWDYGQVRCKFPEVCHYHYHFGDIDLSSSCRLKFSNASSKGVAKCLGSSDYATVTKPGFSEELDQVGRASFSVWQRKVKTEESLKRHMKLGLSEDCASCYVDVSVCTTSHCLGLMMMAGHNSSQARECFKDHKCLEELATCTGLPS